MLSNLEEGKTEKLLEPSRSEHTKGYIFIIKLA